MVGSIDPRCETVHGTPWPNQGRVVVWSSRRGNHLGQRSIATASTGRTYGCKRSDQTRKNSCGTGAVHIWVPAFALGHAHIWCDGLTQVLARGFQNREFV